MTAARIGVDTGGTFTDAMAAGGEVVKLPSDPADPAAPVATAVRSLGGADVLAHGTTVATNALLERRGGRVALITSPGQRDVIEIARQARPSLYDAWVDRPVPLVPRELRFENGDPLVLDGVDAVAVCLLHADLDAEGEQAVARALGAAPGIPTVLSSEVSPEYREYERTVTTVLNAYLRRPCHAYLAAQAAIARGVLVMTSAGGLIPLERAVERPVALLLSGPAGGVLAASAAAAAAGFTDCVTLDMGGTSTDVCLIRGGRPEPAAERRVAGLPVRVPSLDVHTIGAGGGSIARIDAGGALRVGPDSAGADPGPACYGRGGMRPTVTDADLVAGRIPSDGFSGLGRLDVAAARAALDRAGVTADGVISVVDQAMVQAVRVVSVERGVDPAGLALVAFGGAGPLHACALADALGMPAVVVPGRAGVLSAVGLLGAPRQEDWVRSWAEPGDHGGAMRAAEDLAFSAAGSLGGGGGGGGGGVGAEVEVEVAVDCRYRGQSHELTVSDPAAFGAEHQRVNGFVMDAAPVEVIAVRAVARRPSPVDLSSLAGPDRRGPVAGPAVVAEADCTVWVADGWVADVHPSGSWILRRSRG